MKLLIIFLLPLQIYAQDITGLWSGFIHTTDKDLPYELAISENNGKLSGYSHTTFILNGVEEVGVKAVTIKNKKGTILVEDEALVFNDFSEGPVKRIKQLDILTLVIEDTAMMLNGTFKTNIIRNYKSITGTIQLRKIDNSQKTKIIPKLNELNLAGTLSFLQPKTKETEVVVTNPPVVEKVKTDIPVKNEMAISSSGKIKELSPVLQPKTTQKDTATVSSSAEEKKSVAVLQPKPKETTIVTTPSQEKKQEVTLQPKAREAAIVTAPSQEKKPEVILQPKPKETAIVPTPSQEKKPEVSLQPKAKEKETVVVPSSVTEKKPSTTSQPKTKEKEASVVSAVTVKTSSPISTTQEKQKQVVSLSKPGITKKEQPDTMSQTKSTMIAVTAGPIVKPMPVQASVVSAAELTKRKTEMIRSVFFKSDSLLLSLYDNGEVDGDTVSVVLNGKIVIASQGLSTKPITKTIYITPDLGDSLQLVMYAENLGSIPPNTGLLILQDGNDRYEIRFAGDFLKNSAVILRRRRL